VTVNDVLDGHVALDLECLVRMTTPSGSGPHFVIALAPACRPME
jgi:hypothetical protein